MDRLRDKVIHAMSLMFVIVFCVCFSALVIFAEMPTVMADLKTVIIAGYHSIEAFIA